MKSSLQLVDRVIIRFITCPSKLQFVKNTLNWIDLTAILPFVIFIVLFLITGDCGTAQNTGAISVIRILRVMPHRTARVPIILPPAVRGYISPYPTVVIVTTAHQKALGILLVFDNRRLWNRAKYGSNFGNSNSTCNSNIEAKQTFNWTTTARQNSVNKLERTFHAYNFPRYLYCNIFRCHLLCSHINIPISFLLAQQNILKNSQN
jgi:hypothetical protein